MARFPDSASAVFRTELVVVTSRAGIGEQIGLGEGCGAHTPIVTHVASDLKEPANLSSDLCTLLETQRSLLAAIWVDS